MRRLPMIAGVAGLLVLTTVPALADRPGRADISTVTLTDTTTFDPCKGMTPGSSVGEAKVNLQENSGKTSSQRYHVQLKVKDGEASNAYNVSLYTVTTAEDGDPLTTGVMVDTCTALDTAAQQLITDAEGAGVKNLKISVPAGSSMIALLRDGDSTVVSSDLATEKFTLQGKKSGKGKNK